MNANMDAGNYDAMTQEAFANAIFAQYSHRLHQLAMEHLAAEVQRKISPEDVVQSALKSFFRKVPNKPPDPDEVEALWGLLSLITIRKCRKWEAFFRCSKRNVQREEFALDDSQFRANEALVEPKTSDTLVASELMDQLLKHFSERQQEMILMRIQGLAIDQIAIECCSSNRTVARTIARAKSILTDLMFDDPLC